MRQLLHGNIVRGHSRRREHRSTAAAALPDLAPKAGPSSDQVPFSGPGLSGHVPGGVSGGEGGVVVVEWEELVAASPVADAGAPGDNKPTPTPLNSVGHAHASRIKLIFKKR